jgi:hypothetical protein
MSMTDREQEVFDEMLAALKTVVCWYGAPPTDAPAIAMVRCAIAAGKRRSPGPLLRPLAHSGKKLA